MMDVITTAGVALLVACGAAMIIWLAVKKRQSIMMLLSLAMVRYLLVLVGLAILSYFLLGWLASAVIMIFGIVLGLLLKRNSNPYKKICNIIVGIPVGYLAGFLFGNGRRVAFWLIVAGMVVWCFLAVDLVSTGISAASHQLQSLEVKKDDRPVSNLEQYWPDKLKQIAVSADQQVVVQQASVVSGYTSTPLSWFIWRIVQLIGLLVGLFITAVVTFYQFINYHAYQLFLDLYHRIRIKDGFTVRVKSQGIVKRALEKIMKLEGDDSTSLIESRTQLVTGGVQTAGFSQQTAQVPGASAGKGGVMGTIEAAKESAMGSKWGNILLPIVGGLWFVGEIFENFLKKGRR